MELHSTRPVANSELGKQQSQMSRRKRRNADANLLIAQGIDRIELGGTRSRIEASRETHKDSKDKRRQHKPPGHGRELDGIEILAVEINVGAVRERPAQEPPEQHAKN